MAALDLLAWAEQLEALAKQLGEEWHARQVRKSGMTPDELREVDVCDWDKKFIKQHVEPRYQAAGKILESVWRNCEFEADSLFQSIVGRHQSQETDFKRHHDIFHDLWRVWLPTNREPGLPTEWTPVVEAAETATRSFATVFRRRALNVVTGEQAAIERINQQNAPHIKLSSDGTLPHSQPPVPSPDNSQAGAKISDPATPAHLAQKQLQWSNARSPSDWLKVFELLNVDCRSLPTFERRRKKGTFRQHPDSTTKSVRLALQDLPADYRDDIKV